MKKTKKKAFRSLGKQITSLRREPFKPEQVEKLNRIFEKDIAQEKTESRIKKIARKRLPEVGM